MATASGAIIRYVDAAGMQRAAVYSSLSNANADLAAINTALAAGEAVTINGYLVVEPSGLGAAIAVNVTPA